jgi:glycosyltransferase involved in cell wall biosynthesis
VSESTQARRVAVVHDWLTGMRGGEMVLEEILRVVPQAEVFTLFHFPGTVSPAIESRPIHTSYLRSAPALRRHYRWYLPFFPRAIESLDLSGFDLVISSSHCVAKGAMAPAGVPHLCYCHTPVRYAWDQQEAYFPRRGGPIERIRNAVLARLRRWDVATATRPRRILANSHFVADRIRRYWDREATVLHPPVDTDYYTPGEGENGAKPYALAVSAPAPYKRVDLAIRACADAGLELRVVGIDSSSPAARVAGPVRWLGRVERDRLRALYRGAVAFVQPGIEDFGIAAVEALACGTPVAAAAAGGVLDIVAEEGFGVLYSPDEPTGLSGALDKIQKNRFNKMKLRDRAESFSSARFRERFAATLASMMTSAPEGRV